MAHSPAWTYRLPRRASASWMSTARSRVNARFRQNQKRSSEALNGSAQACERIGLEAGPLSQSLYGELAEAGLPVICIETRHIRAVLAAQVNKTDRNDARGIAQMMRVGLFRPVHVKTLQSQQRRMLLTTHKLLQSNILDLESRGGCRRPSGR
jgi:transposase